MFAIESLPVSCAPSKPVRDSFLYGSPDSIIGTMYESGLPLLGSMRNHMGTLWVK